MSDNTRLNNPTVDGGDIIATDEINGVKHQRVKMQTGADGEATDVSAANPIPTALSANAVTASLIETAIEMISQNTIIIEQLRLLNLRVEEAFNTKINERDIE